MSFTIAVSVPLVVAVALVASAPVAQARQTCRETSSHVRCETNGSVSIKAVPTTRATPPVYGWPSGRSGVILSW
ncbi:hypothetical protein BCA37_16975 [Mycobacterium sp. djl-10]|nr:hypothetical protein BCA37_16975 [Mycobacterium sp. djl-10]